MNNKRVRWLASAVIAAALAVVAVVAVAQARDGGGDDSIGKIRAANARFQDTKTAQAEGWDLRPGLDNCFEKPGTGSMGFHYINLAQLQDLSEDPLKPEAFVYAPSSWGQMELGAVEWIVPQKEWDAAGNYGPPELLGQHFHLDTTLGVYILHAWIFKDNPAGLFQDFNPKASPCPAS
ncbi:MAG: hypothetical protein ABI577_10965 [bacterium]